MTRIPANSPVHVDGAESSFAMRFHLLGTVGFEDSQRLQRHLLHEAGGRQDGCIVVVLCEHPCLISVGRSGSRGHIRWTNEQLRLRRLDVRWVNRGGGCVLHTPGQLAIYPIVPLTWHRWTVGEYLRRFRQALTRTLDEMGIRWETYAPSSGVWGRSGQLAACGVAVHNWITCHGAFVNVNPPMTNFGFVDVVDPLTTVSGQKSTMGSLFAERRQAVSIPKVRATLIPQLAASFGTDRYHLVTGHPLLMQTHRPLHGTAYRAS